jgi:hypothetical protein
MASSCALPSSPWYGSGAESGERGGFAATVIDDWLDKRRRIGAGKVALMEPEPLRSEESTTTLELALVSAPSTYAGTPEEEAEEEEMELGDHGDEGDMGDEGDAGEEADM